MISILATLLLGCEPELEACDTMAAYSTTVEVTDADGGEVPGLTLSYSVDGEELGTCDQMQGTTWACGVERSGNFVITAKANEFVTQTAETDVVAGECHVVAELVDISLEAETYCTAEYVPAMNVNVVGASGETLEGQMVQFRSAETDGAPWEDCEGEGQYWQCAFEQVGTFDVKAWSSGHKEAFELVTVAMDEAGCHPVTEQVDFALQWGDD